MVGLMVVDGARLTLLNSHRITAYSASKLVRLVRLMIGVSVREKTFSAESGTSAANDLQSSGE